MRRKSKATFELEYNAPTIFKPKIQVPFAAREIIEKELGIRVLSKADDSAWEKPTVYVKNNKIRVCADYSAWLNDCLKTYNYPLLGREEIFARLNEGKIFSKLDLSDASQQILLEEECTNLLTINTLIGLY